MDAPNLAAAPDPDDEQVLAERALRAVKAEVAAELPDDDEPDDGCVTAVLHTRFGEGKFRVPPFNQWGSVARNALNRQDDLTWAQRTLTPIEALEWMRLDPTTTDTDRFFNAWADAVGQSLGESSASRRSSTRTRGR